MILRITVLGLEMDRKKGVGSKLGLGESSVVNEGEEERRSNKKQQRSEASRFTLGSSLCLNRKNETPEEVLDRI